MREFSTLLNQALLNGLKSNASADDAAFFSDLMNIVPYELGARSYEEVYNPLETVRHQYPFPQWFRFENDNFVLTPADLIQVDESYQPFELAFKSTQDWNLGKLQKSMRYVDYGSSWILLSPEGCIFKKGGKVMTQTSLKASGLTKHKNRTIIGGATQGLWTPQWIDALEGLSFPGKDKLLDFKLGKNVVFWSDFDSIIFPFGLLLPEDYVSRETLVELLSAQDFGFLVLPTPGAILEVVSSQGQLFVFAEDNLVSMTQSQLTGGTFAITGQQKVGLKCRGAVGGDEDSLIFIDNENQLWRITNGLIKLDFRKYMSELIDDEIFISKDADEEIFYIGDSQKSFLLKNNQLTRVFQTVHSLNPVSAVPSGVTFRTAKDEAVIETSELDIGLPSNKTLTGIFISSNRPLKGVAKASSQVNGKRVEGRPTHINHQGYAASRIFGRRQKVRVEIPDYKELEIDRIELKWQVDDNRQTRGIFSATGTTREGE